MLIQSHKRYEVYERNQLCYLKQSFSENFFHLCYCTVNIKVSKVLDIVLASVCTQSYLLLLYTKVTLVRLELSRIYSDSSIRLTGYQDENSQNLLVLPKVKQEK